MKLKLCRFCRKEFEVSKRDTKRKYCCEDHQIKFWNNEKKKPKYREQLNKYQRAWSKANHKKRSKYLKKYNAKNKEYLSQYRKEWRIKNYKRDQFVKSKRHFTKHYGKNWELAMALHEYKKILTGNNATKQKGKHENKSSSSAHSKSRGR